MAINEQLILEIRADVAQLKKGIAQSKGSVNRFQNSLKGVAGTIKVALSAAMTAAAVSSVRMAKTWDKSLTQIVALVGVSKKEVAEMGEAARNMAVRTGKSSNEAAEALFFITSAGLRGADAMAVLDASLKASAVGLGETKTIADLATSALNAYKGSGMTASDATDVLTAAVREGKLEASELASAMGQVLPVASNMGVSFNEVGAAFAAMSRTGTNASQAATALNGIMVALLKETPQTEKAMTDIGLSFDGLRAQIKEEGLISVLTTLKGKFGDNEDAMKRIFPNVQGLKGIMDLVGASAEDNVKIFEALNNVTGATNKSFEDSKSASFEFDVEIAKLKNTLLSIGETLLPIVNAGLKAFNYLIGNSDDAYATDLELAQNALKGLEENLQKAENKLASWNAKGIENERVQQKLELRVQQASQAVENQTSIVTDLTLALDDTTEATDKLNEAGNKNKTVTTQQTQAYTDYKLALTELKNEAQIMGGEFDLTAGKIDLMKSSLINLLNAGEGSSDMFKEIKSELATLEAEEMGMEADLSFNMDDDSWIDNDPALQNILANTTTWGEELKAAHQEINAAIAEQNRADSELLEATINERNERLLEQDRVLLEQKNQMMMQAGEYIATFMGQVHQGLTELTGGLVDSLGLADKGVQGFLKSILKALAQVAVAQLVGLIQKKIMAKIQGKIDKKQAMGSGIAAASNQAAAMGPAGLAALPLLIAAAVGTVGAAFGSIQAFAKGGIVTKPMMGLVGEAGSEAIIPLDRLENMVSPTSGEFTLRGQDLVLALNRADNFKDRIMN